MSHQGAKQSATVLQAECLRVMAKFGSMRMNRNGRWFITNDKGRCDLWVTQKTIEGLALRGLVVFKGWEGDVHLSAKGRAEAARLNP